MGFHLFFPWCVTQKRLGHFFLRGFLKICQRARRQPAENKALICIMASSSQNRHLTRTQQRWFQPWVGTVTPLGAEAPRLRWCHHPGLSGRDHPETITPVRAAVCCTYSYIKVSYHNVWHVIKALILGASLLGDYSVWIRPAQQNIFPIGNLPKVTCPRAATGHRE